MNQLELPGKAIRSAAEPFVYRGVPLRPIAFLNPANPLDSVHNGTSDALSGAACALDIAASRRFLAQCGSDATVRLYERELDRLLLWAWAEAGKNLPALTADDFTEYASFLADPRPHGIWCGKKTRRESIDWRPFEGPLHEKARNTAISVTNSLMRFVTDIGYVQGSALPHLRSTPPRRDKHLQVHGPASGTIQRSLDPQAWEAVRAALEALPKSNDREIDKYERLCFICAFCYWLAPRVSEIERQRFEDFVWIDGVLWWSGEAKHSLRDMYGFQMKWKPH